MRQYLILGASAFLTACLATPQVVDEKAYLPDPPAVSPPPPGRDLAGPARYCGEGFALDIRAGETVHLLEVETGGAVDLYSTPLYPGVTLRTADGSLGIHQLSQVDWMYSHLRTAFRELRGGEKEHIPAPGLGALVRFTLHYTEAGQNSDYRVGYLATDGSDQSGDTGLLFVSPQFDGSARDLAWFDRIRLVNAGECPIQ